MPEPSPPPATPAPVTTTADARDLVHYIEVMEALIDVIQQETDLRETAG
jgi:hypothetical protein